MKHDLEKVKVLLIVHEVHFLIHVLRECSKATNHDGKVAYLNRLIEKLEKAVA